MIGVISSEREEGVVREFFELFKTPWEFCTSGHSYDVAISTRNESTEWKAKLVLVYSSETGAFDSEKNLIVESQSKTPTLVWNAIEFPLYGNALTFDGKLKTIIRMKEASKNVGIRWDIPETKFARIGYDLFEEVSFLLSSGQPRDFANIPTLEIHISILRELILDAGIHLVEIQPDGSDVAHVLSSLATQPERLLEISRRNAVEALLRHDWVYRWKTILKIVGLEPTPALEIRENRLKQMAEQATNEE